jgi:hypothetical protein
VREEIRSRRHALVVIGTADPYDGPVCLTGLQASTLSEVKVVDGADHNMEIGDDVECSLLILQKVTRDQGISASNVIKAIAVWAFF